MSVTSEITLSRAQLHDIWKDLSESERLKRFHELSFADAQDFFLKLEAPDKAAIILALAQPERRLWLRLLNPDDVADVIQETIIRFSY